MPSTNPPDEPPLLIYEGDPVATLTIASELDLELVITFHAEGREIGRLWWDKEDELFKFEGDLDESAIRLFELVKNNWMRYFDAAYGPNYMEKPDEET